MCFRVVCVHDPFQNEAINHVDRVEKFLAHMQEFFAYIQNIYIFLLFLKLC